MFKHLIFSPLGAPWLRASSRTRGRSPPPDQSGHRRQSRSLSHDLLGALCQENIDALIGLELRQPRQCAEAWLASAPYGRRPKSRCSLRPSTDRKVHGPNGSVCFADRPRNDPASPLLWWIGSPPSFTPSLLMNDCLPAPGVGRVPSKFLRSGSF